MEIKKFSVGLLFFTLICVFNIAAITASYAEEYYNTTQMSDDLVYYEPQINANGYVTWYGGSGVNNTPLHVYLYDGHTVIELQHPNFTSSMHSRINDNGYVVWQAYDGHDYEILLYDGSQIIQLTNNSYDDYYPKINNQGHVVWQGRDINNIRVIYLYDGNQIIQLPNNSNFPDNPQISDNGYVVWEGYNGTDTTTFEIFLYDGNTTIQLTNNLTKDRFPRINETGHVVWLNNGNVFLYNGIIISQITNHTSAIATYAQTAGKYISWIGRAGSTSIDYLFLYDGINTTQLPYAVTGAVVGAEHYPMTLYPNGHIVWNSGGEIYLYNGKTRVQITNTAYSDSLAKMNANGSIVWSRYNGVGYSISTIALATPYRADITISDSIATAYDITIPFSDLTINNSSNETITIKNDGTANLNIGLIAGTNTLSVPFSITADNCSSKVLAPSASCTLTVRFTPTISGSFSDSFNIPSDDTDEPMVTINLSGVGEAIPLFPEITVSDSLAPVDDLFIPFGNVTVKNSSSRTVTITNNGTANLNIGLIASTDSLSAPFSITTNNCSSKILAPAARCTLTIRFLPTVIGNFADSFSIPSNDADEGLVTMRLSGSGVKCTTTKRR